MNRDYTADLVRRHEGIRYVTYDDTGGNPTVGIGRLLAMRDKDNKLFEVPGIRRRFIALDLDFDKVLAGLVRLTDLHVEALFEVDLNDAIALAPGIVRNFDEHPDPIQAVIVDMIYNLGPTRFSKFVDTVAAFEHKDYPAAADAMADSAWARFQVPERAEEDIAIVRSQIKENQT
jgi:GH24 family phage-related lysozyme (muramidase)